MLLMTKLQWPLGLLLLFPSPMLKKSPKSLLTMQVEGLQATGDPIQVRVSGKRGKTSILRRCGSRQRQICAERACADCHAVGRPLQVFKPATGLPPHVMIYAHLKETNHNVSAMPDRIFQQIESRGMLGDLSLVQITRAVEDGHRLTTMANGIAALRRIVQEGIISAGGSHDRSAARQNIRLVCEFKHGDGKYSRVPSSWTFPSLQLQNMYLYWHCGHEAL